MTQLKSSTRYSAAFPFGVRYGNSVTVYFQTVTDARQRCRERVEAGDRFVKVILPVDYSEPLTTND